jgi:hypothetical protein
MLGDEDLSAPGDGCVHSRDYIWKRESVNSKR